MNNGGMLTIPFYNFLLQLQLLSHLSRLRLRLKTSTSRVAHKYE